MSLSIVILAAGQGTRMRSDLPKVLHTVAGQPLLAHVIATARGLEAGAIHVVYGHGGEQVRKTLTHLDVNWVLQAQQLGTGHAVAQALPAIADKDTVLVLYGDVPLTTAATLTPLLAHAQHGALGLLTAHLDNPQGYGRIVRDAQDAVARIVEQKDANETERRITEVNTGMLAVNAASLKRWIAQLDKCNAQGEFYLTDIIALAAQDRVPIHTAQASSIDEILGVNDRVQLADLERRYQQREAARLMRDGVSLRDPLRFDLRGELTVGRDVIIDINVIIEGKVHLGDRVHIGPNTLLHEVDIAADTQVFSHCVIEQARIGARCRIGPFARIRPETALADDVHIGNFVEIKKSQVADGSKINHLSYVGDSDVGRRVNIGAGTITCNYDGANKHRTVIEDDVFIGSDTQLIAPVTVGKGATLGAGTTLTRDAPAGELTLARAGQKTIAGWKRPVKK
ncbi:MAG: bifunctional UDP-N-acetylglucosamine diphosphorylase/glucosamine-1-phosphate N-acetyltransferase GlmU [Gammaproteobacteria bacterium]